VKIDCIRTYHVRYELPEPFSYSQLEFRARNCLLVEVLADGTSGWGEAYGPAEVGQAAVTSYYAPLLLGTDPADIESLWHTMWQSSIDFSRHGPMMGAISALDMALWDLKGKSLSVPVWSLMGGRFREAVPCYITRMYFQDLPDEALVETLIDEARGYRDQGYDKLKIKVGRNLDFDVRLVTRLREELPEATLMADANHAYDLPEAIRVGRAMDEADFAWFEEPLSPLHPEMFPQLHTKLDVPLASGEAEQTRYGFQKLLAPGGVQIAQPDLAYCGGPSEALKIRAVATSLGINVIPHVWGTMLNFAAATHFLASTYREPGRACVSHPVIEYDRTPNALRDEMFEKTIEIKDQCAVVPSEPGLGVAVDRKAMQSFLVRETENR
jgi:D-galactarolactone cycloisomerase